MPLDTSAEANPTLVGFRIPEVDFGLTESQVSFPVEELPLAAVLADGSTCVSDTHKTIVADPDSADRRVVGVVGENYSLLRNADYFGTIEEAIRGAVRPDLLEGVQVRDSVAGGGSWCKREYVLPAFAEVLRTSTDFETQIGLRIITWNSYDGSASAGLLTGLIDFYCTNGMIVGRNIERTIRRHTSGLSPRLFEDPLRRSIERTQEEVRRIEEMAQRPLEQDGVVEFLEANFSGRLAGQLLSRVQEEVQRRGENVHALHSALTYYASHDSEQFPTRNRRDTSVRILHQREEEVQRALGSDQFAALMAA